MGTYRVTNVRRELSKDGSHKHIEGVCADSVHYSIREVVESMNQGNTWKTAAGGYEETIVEAAYCHKTNCWVTPYIKTNPDSTELDNLENLPEC